MLQDHGAVGRTRQRSRGAYTTAGQWFQLKWPSAWEDIRITVKELLPIILGVWCKEWEGKTIRCRCDNAAVVAAVNSGRSKNDWMMDLLRSAFLLQPCIILHLWRSTFRGYRMGRTTYLVMITCLFLHRTQEPARSQWSSPRPA